MDFLHFAETKLSPSQRDWLKSVLSRFNLLEPGLKAALHLESGCELDHKILVGTHHKTGTVWLGNVFRTICRFHGLAFYMGKQAGLPAEYDVFLQEHSQFDLKALGAPFRGIHMIRDPRDVVISGCFYHQRSKEAWLHQPMEELGGMTYQEKINTYSDVDDQLLFEMENSARITIRDMLAWDYDRPEFRELKYEELIQDHDLGLFHEVFTFLGFPGSVIPSLLAISFNKSLFSGRVKKSSHLRSGKAREWKGKLKPIHKERFVELFGDGLVKLGYENDNSWAEA